MHNHRESEIVSDAAGNFSALFLFVWSHVKLFLFSQCDV